MRENFNNLAPKIRAEYGDWLSNLDIDRIIRARELNAICQNCTGLPCLREWNRCFVLSINVDENSGLNISYAPCKFQANEMHKKTVSRNFNRCQIPAKYVGKDFSSYEVTGGNEEAVEWAKYVIENPSQGLMFYGVPGCGKTHLAAIIAQEHIKRGRSVIFSDVPNLLDTLKATFDRNNDESGEKQANLDTLMKDLIKVDVLVLDDIGTEKATEWAMERLYIIVNDRYNAKRPIIATSNFNAEGLENKYQDIKGKRIVSRISEMCKAILIRGSDRRKRR